jgi:hypothetical protein
MEIGARVPLAELATAMEDWFRRKSYLPKDAKLVVEEIPGCTIPVIPSESAGP